MRKRLNEKETDRKKEYWAWKPQQLVHVLNHERVNLLLQAPRKETTLVTTTDPLPPTHFGLHYVIVCNNEDVSCMFSHCECDQCWELITVDMLGVVAARPGCSTILMTQFSIDCDRKGSECEVYSKINQSSSRFIDCRGYANTILRKRH